MMPSVPRKTSSAPGPPGLVVVVIVDVPLAHGQGAHRGAARSSTSARICCRRCWVSGTTSPPRRSCVHRISSTSGAPFVTTTKIAPHLVEVHGAHQLSLRRERHLVDARYPSRPRRAPRRPSQSSSAFGGISGRPTPSCSSIVAGSGPPANSARRMSPAFGISCNGNHRRRDLAERVVAGAALASPPTGVTASRTVISLRVSVPVLSVQIVVAAPSVSTAESPADNRVPRGHALHAEREHHGEDRRQSLGHRGDRERDPDQHHVDQRGRALDLGDGEDRGDHDDRDRDDRDAQYPADASDLALQRRSDARPSRAARRSGRVRSPCPWRSRPRLRGRRSRRCQRRPCRCDRRGPRRWRRRRSSS